MPAMGQAMKSNTRIQSIENNGFMLSTQSVKDMMTYHNSLGGVDSMLVIQFGHVMLLYVM
jgi:hypothetical protein